MRVEHEVEKHRFHLSLPAGEGELRYHEVRPGVLSFWHTEVDPALRGTGAASALVRAAMEFARASGQRVVPDCPYVGSWVLKHPEFESIIARK